MNLESVVEKAARAAALSDEEVVGRVLDGEQALFEVLVRRYNQRLYRVALGILGDEDEAEDVMQDAYVRAYAHLGQFAGAARFSTWLTRIAVHEALARARRRRRMVEMDAMPNESQATLTRSNERDPEERAIGRDLRTVLEAAIRSLPDTYRPVVVLRDVEGLSTAETADCLGLSEPVIKTRLHRGRMLLRRGLEARSRGVLSGAFDFHLSRCDRVVAAVFTRIGIPPSAS